MTSFGWKKKAPALKRNLVREVGDFEGREEEEVPPPPKVAKIESKDEQVLRLKEEGIFHAEKGEFWQSISKFDDAIQILNSTEEPKNGDASASIDNAAANDDEESAANGTEVERPKHPDGLHQLRDMKAQSLMQLHEWEPAIESAGLAVQDSSKSWSPALQTLGRAYLGNGQVFQAVDYFSKALHLDPSQAEHWEDLEWANSLRTHLKLMQAARQMRLNQA